MKLLRMALESMSANDTIWPTAFFKKYPEHKDQLADYYVNLCQEISEQFVKMLADDFKVASTVIIGKGINYNYLEWMTEPAPRVQEILSKHKVSTGHAAVLINNKRGIIYDMSSKQFVDKQYTVYNFSDFEKRWNKVRLLG